MNPFVKLGLDIGPLIAFFVVNMAWPGPAIVKVMAATVAFMIATGIAIVWAKLRHGSVSAMLLVSGVMVLVFGGLTLWLHSETFIKIKPTVYYGTIASILFYGLIAKKPTLELVLGQAYPGLTPRGWTLLTRNWAFFFVLLGIANELVWRNSSTSFWIGYKLWGSLPATLVFAVANVPMLMRHGLNAEAAKQDPPLPLDG
ncbi:MAG: intracellular septation protein A [Sphingomonas sp.]|nr:MAG: intracellular septation protein A [Sphingomonas sp.]